MPVASSAKSYWSVMLHVLPTQGCGSVRRYGTVPPSGYAISLACNVALCQLALATGMFFQSSMATVHVVGAAAATAPIVRSTAAQAATSPVFIRGLASPQA